MPDAELAKAHHLNRAHKATLGGPGANKNSRPELVTSSYPLAGITRTVQGFHGSLKLPITHTGTES